jgi:RHS repeat-associated protein
LIVYDANETGDKKWRWVVADQLGSPRMNVDKTGTLAGITRHDYLPFGEELGAGVGIRSTTTGYTADTIRQKFTSYERDSETGLDYAQARYYANVQGRFTSVDPGGVGAYTGNPQTWNGYAYALNNPVFYSDPDGRRVKVCYNGDCHEQSDKQFLDSKNTLQKGGFTVKGGKIFNAEGEQIGTYTRISFDDLPGFSNGVLFGIQRRTANTGSNLLQLQLVAITAGLANVSAPFLLLTSIAESLAFVKNAYDPQTIIVGGQREADRQHAVREAWRQEAELVRTTGQGTRDWTPDELRELRDTGKVSGYEGHHINNVNDHPQLARDPDNIKFVKGRGAHLAEHGGNFKNKTSGPLIKRR